MALDTPTWMTGITPSQRHFGAAETSNPWASPEITLGVQQSSCRIRPVTFVENPGLDWGCPQGFGVMFVAMNHLPCLKPVFCWPNGQFSGMHAPTFSRRNGNGWSWRLDCSSNVLHCLTCLVVNYPRLMICLCSPSVFWCLEDMCSMCHVHYLGRWLVHCYSIWMNYCTTTSLRCDWNDG